MTQIALALLLTPALCRGDRPVALPEWLSLGAEYRVETLYVDPLDLTGTEVTDVHWTEQRLRLDLGLRYPDVGGVVMQADVLSGVMFGDNGRWGGDPSPNSGLAIASRNPNDAGWEIGLSPGADPLDPKSYVPVLRSMSPISIRHLYGEVRLPIGLLRVGRQPLTEGAAIAAHDGSRTNRWGVSRFSDVADRVLFATKLDEIVATIRDGASHVPDASQTRGVILAATYDWNVQDFPTSSKDDAWQVNVMLSWRRDKADWLGLAWRDFQLTGIVVHKSLAAFGTSAWSFPVRFQAAIGDATVNLQVSVIAGETREVSEGLSRLSSKTPSSQDLLQVGVHAYVDYKVGPVTFALEADYASGDDDPRGNTSLTQFNFSRDFNVGLLLFEHLLAFQTARSAAVGLQNLAKLDSPSFPLTEIASQTRFGNAVAVFPQLDVTILESPKHRLHTRVGVLAAWAPTGAVDPVNTLLHEDGVEISDDLVNYNGGKPGSYYGTEIDLQVEWTWRELFTWTVEAAAAIPGDALRDANGDAVPSFLVENRFVFTF